MPEAKKTETNLHEAYKSKRGPKALIDFFFYKVNFFESLMIIIIAVLLNILIYGLLKGPELMGYSLTQVYTTILLNWIFIGIIVFLIMYFIIGQKALPKKPFEKILSALASFRLTTIIYTILTAVLVIVFFPSIISVIQAVSQNINLINSTTLFSTLTTLNIIGIVLFILLTIFMFIYWVIMLYEFTEIVFNVKDFGSKVGLMIIMFAILVAINALLV